MRVLGIAATGMQAQQTNVEVISNNIANMNTTGYKRSRAEFKDLLYQSERRPGSMSSDTGTIVPAGIQIGLGTATAAVARSSEQGALTKTDNPLDLAIDGKGYFIVNMPDGTQAYTRAGSFQKSPEGTIVNVDGHEIGPGITLPPNTTDIVINQSGEVMAYVEGATEPENVGQLTIATFMNEAGLQAIGDSLFKATPASGDPLEDVAGAPGFGIVRQRYVEGSNVNAVSEITNLISAQRAYEMNSKVVETADQMAGTVSNMR